MDRFFYSSNYEVPEPDRNPGQKNPDPAKKKNRIRPKKKPDQQHW
jgi:hypothetical protein